MSVMNPRDGGCGLLSTSRLFDLHLSQSVVSRELTYPFFTIREEPQYYSYVDILVRLHKLEDE